MFLFVLIVCILIFGYSTNKVWQCKKYERRDHRVIGSYKRKNQVMDDKQYFLICVFAVSPFCAAFFGSMYGGLIVIPLLLTIYIVKVNIRADIILLEDGLLYNRTYIRWLDVDKVFSKDTNNLAVVRKGSSGEFTIGGIIEPEKLSQDINELLGERES